MLSAMGGGIHQRWYQGIEPCSAFSSSSPSPSVVNGHTLMAAVPTLVSMTRITHVGDFLLHPRGRFQGRRPTQPWGRWCRGLQITARRGCRGVLLRLCLLRFLSPTNIRSGKFSGSTTYGGVRNLSGTKGKKSSSPDCQLHDGSTFHPLAKHCHAFAGPDATR